MTHDDEDKDVWVPNHKGSIDMVLLDESTSSIVSGGEDGFLRWWSISEMDEAEADYDKGILEYPVTLKKEIRIPAESTPTAPFPAHIQHVARSKDDATWLIQDGRNGCIWKYDRESNETQQIFKAPAGGMSGAIVTNFSGLVITASTDGTLRALNMASKADHELFLDRRGQQV